MEPTTSPLLLEVNDLKTYFYLDEGVVRAVDGVTFQIRRGQTIGIVGESGCGKSALARSILRIVPRPGKTIGGEVRYFRPSSRDKERPGLAAIDLVSLDPTGPEIRAIRGAEISMIFQEPMTSLSPVHTIGNQIIETILLHQQISVRAARAQVIETLGLVGMPRPQTIVDRYPHQLSGGMRQRAMIAMALSCRPNLLIADEPTTALDVTTQAQILSLMQELQALFGMAIMFITHDLGVIAQMTEYVVVMYLGRIVESGAVDAIFYQPKHPYTQALLHSIHRLGQDSNVRLQTIEGAVPDASTVPGGCPFHPRCPYNDQKRCVTETPVLRPSSDGQFVCCHYADELTLTGIF